MALKTDIVSKTSSITSSAGITIIIQFNTFITLIYHHFCIVLAWIRQ